MPLQRAVAIVVLAALVAALAVGCGSVGRTPEGEGSAASGRELFRGEGQCGGCHTLADAGTQSDIGPNLDHSFELVREQGFDESTIRDVVRGQIAYPTENPAGLDEDGNPFVGMPANLLRGQNAADVAAYVAAVAGREVENAEPSPPATGGEALFVQNCGSCHVLSAADTAGTIGPSLDQLRPDAERVLEAMREGPGAMPSFADQLEEAQLEEIATYVAENAGG